MPTSQIRKPTLEDRMVERLVDKALPILVSVVFVALGLLYCFRWGPVVRHKPDLWITPGDIWTTYRASAAAAHGHFSAVYGPGFLAFPGILAAFAPLGALINSFTTTAIQVTQNGLPTAGVHYLLLPGTPYFLADVARSGSKLYDIHREASVVLLPVMLLLSCVALFALDALAERLGVGRQRRAVLCVVQGVLLWPVTVFAGHPEDAVALALAVYALIFAFDRRFTGAGWLFGAAVAVQPLVIVLFPLLLALGGRSRALGLVVKGALPAVVLTIPPLAAGAHDTLHALVDQPTFPNVGDNHRTPWLFLAPKLGGSGQNAKVGGGPTRIIALALAAALGWWALRWRDRPEMIVWAAALALALRTYTESVMTPYYVWPALAVGVIVAARANLVRFAAGATIAVLATIVGQWQLSEFTWWAVQVVGVTALLAVAVRPDPTPVAAESDRPAATQQRKGSSKSQAKKTQRKSARTARKRTARR